MMAFRVRLTHDAERDLRDIVLDQIERSLVALRESPERGAFPKELIALGIREYREVFFKPYRVVYRIADGDVIVFVIADGRRDFQALLSRRLLEG